MAISSDKILLLGDDQMSSQWQLIFPNGLPSGGDTDSIGLRVDTTFDPPENTVNTYEFFHKGYKFPMTGMLQETDKTFTIEVRLDQQWKVYDDLLAWSKMTYDHSNGTALSEITARTTVIVQAQDRQQNKVANLKFKYAKLKNEPKIGSFDNASGDPIRLTLTFIFIEMIKE